MHSAPFCNTWSTTDVSESAEHTEPPQKNTHTPNIHTQHCAFGEIKSNEFETLP